MTVHGKGSHQQMGAGDGRNGRTVRAVCVYCASSQRIDESFNDAARELGTLIGRRGWSLVYGGGNVGTMGAVARASQQAGARVIGVIPQFMVDIELAYREADELLVVDDMRARKAMMEARSDAFIALPGGFGTLEELVEVVTLRRLGRHSKPVIILNHAGFYDPLLEMFEHLYESRFASPKFRSAYKVAQSPAEALALIDAEAASVPG